MALTEVQQVILTCLLGPEDTGAFAREKRRLYQMDWESRQPGGSNIYRKTRRALQHVKKPMARKERGARWRSKNPQYDRNRWLGRAYGISPLELQKMLEEQSGLCAICSGVFIGTPNVDHNHATGKVRGLLCIKCNRGIGFLQDNPTICSAAADYLKRAK